MRDRLALLLVLLVPFLGGAALAPGAALVDIGLVLLGVLTVAVAVLVTAWLSDRRRW